ncbi:MAG: hypothetical protein R2777_02875 [Chitinophagales bacterium]
MLKKCKYCEIDHRIHYNYKSDIDSAFIEKDYCGKELDEVEGANNSVRLYYKGDSLTTVYIYLNVDNFKTQVSIKIRTFPSLSLEVSFNF